MNNAIGTRWTVIALLVSLAVAAFSVFSNEQILRHGQSIYLRLAPVDPRSLMQGDYMALRFAIADDIRDAFSRTESSSRAERKSLRSGTAVIKVDAKGEASFVALGRSAQAGESLLRFQNTGSVLDGSGIQISTNAFFFQEGQGKRFEQARFGEFKVDKDGRALLIRLLDENLRPL